MEFTQNTSEYLRTQATGYMVNTLLSHESQLAIAEIQDSLQDRFPTILWSTPPEALHVTLLDWLAPLVDYNQSKDDLYKKLFAEYDTALNDALTNIKPIEVHFNKVLVSSSAIALVADDTNIHPFTTIRTRFLDSVVLLPDTKQPPTIVHSTIARFIGTAALDEVRMFAETLHVSVHETIKGFQLVRETELPMLAYTAIKKYPLSTAKV